MNNKQSNPPNTVRTALCRVLSVGVGVIVALPAAFAQDTGTDATTLEKVVVTGTRLTAAEAEGSLSVTTIELASPINSGFTKLGDVLRVKLPQYGGSGVLNEGFGNGGSGGSYISLRGLPGDATLVLVNGRRTSTSDLNLIPEAAIDRIDILNDGSGAIYGTDAVAGVVNVILKEEFNGVKLGAYYANTTDKDISQRKVSALFGATTEKSKFVVSAEYSASNEQMAVDRLRSRPARNQVSATSNPGTFVSRESYGTHPVGELRVPNRLALRWSLVPGNTRGLTSSNQVPVIFDPLASADTTAALTSGEATRIRNAEEARLNSLLPANSPVRYGVSPSLVPGVDPGFPFGYYTIGYRPHEKYSTYFSADHQLFDKHLAAFASGYYVRNTSLNQLAPSPLSGRVLSGGNYWFQQVFPAAAARNIPVTVGYRPVELGPRITYNEFENFHGVAGLKGQIGESSWKWDLTFLWDRTEIDSEQTGGVRAEEYNRLLGLGTSDAWNPFGYTPIGGSSVVNPASTVQSLRASAGTKDLYSVMSLEFGVGGELFDLPGGAVSTAIGAATRKDKLDHKPDFALQNGLVFPFNEDTPFDAQRDIDAAYGEFHVPVFGNDFTIPAFSSLSFQGALRYEQFDDVGDTGVKPRVSFRWQPVGKDLTIRGSYAEGFIAPAFGDLYATPGQNFTELLNPITGLREQPPGAVIELGNPKLAPSDAESWLFGFLYSPEYVKGLSVGANYYQITQNGIPFQSAQYIVNQWFRAGPDNPNNPFGPNAVPSSANPTGAQVEVNEQSELEQIRNVAPINTGERFTDGIDLTARQEFETGVGKITLDGRAAHILTWEQENFPGAGKIDYLGSYWSGGPPHADTSFPEWRANFTIEYEYDRFYAAVGWNYIAGYREDITEQDFTGPPENPSEVAEVRSYQTFDLVLGYNVPWIEANLRFGVNNFLDEQPALVQSSFENGYDRAIADIRGRMWFVSITKEF